MSDQRIKLIIEAVNKADAAFNDLKRQLKGSQVDTDALNAKSKDLTGSIKSLAAGVVSLGAALTVLKAGISYLAKIETSALGIAAAFMTGGKYIDAVSGKALAAQDALNAAQGDSKKIIEELQYANLQTIATLDELINAYQVTLPVALAKGFDRRQVKDFTVAMVQAAGAIGLQMNQLAEETRSLLTGAIDPRTSRIATVLGLRNEDINKFKGDADGLFGFLMDKLAAYRTAGIEAQKTWAGLWSNFKDIINQSLGKAFEPLFEALKYELQSVADSIVTIDNKAKKIKWNPEFMEGITAFREGIENIIAEVYRLGMLLDKIGGSFTRLMHDVTFEALRGGNRWTNANDEYRKRYMKSEKALQDMALRSQGWKPVTPEFDKKLLTASPEEKKKYQYFQTDVGEEGQGTKQALRYYRDTGPKKDVEWKGKTPSADVDKNAARRAAKAAKEIEDARKKKLEADAKSFEIGMQNEESWARIKADFDKDREDAQKKKLDADVAAFELGMKYEDDAARESKENAKDKADAYRTMFGDMQGSSQEYYNFQLQALDKERENYEKLIGDKILTDKWYLKKKRELDQEQAINSESFLKGMLAQNEKLNDSALTMGQAGSEMMKSISTSMKTTFSDVFMDSWTGKLDSARDYFRSFAQSLAKTFADLCSQMISDWIRQQMITGIMKIAGSAAGSFSGGAGGGGEGMTSAGWTGTSGGGTVATNASGWHGGGVPGHDRPSFYRIVPAGIFADAQRYHTGIGPGEKAAIIKNDEGVFTAGQMKALGKDLNRQSAATEVKIDIANIVSPDLLDSYLATGRGQNAVLNLISSRSGTVKRILAGS